MTTANKDKTENLKPFQPGQSGNPSGRPKVNTLFRDNCREFMDAEGWERLKALAINGRSKDHMKALELIAAYAYGKPKQGIDLSTPDGALKIKVSVTDDD